MELVDHINALHDEMTAWRRDIHAHPELGFEEQRTSDLVAAKLAEFGCEVHRGLAGTGVVGVLRAGNAPGSIGLRADMDALPIQEANDVRTARTMPAGCMRAAMTGTLQCCWARRSTWPRPVNSTALCISFSNPQRRGWAAPRR